LVVLAVATASLAPAAARGATVATSCRASDRTDVAYARRPGVARSATSLDVYPAARACRGARSPVVMWVHGGGWSVGDKARLGAKLDLFRDLGAAVVSVNYRLSPRGGASGGDDRVQHPDHVEDVAAAVAWVADHARSFGGDPDRIVLVGHSAGAHLVSLIGAAPALLEAAGVPDGALRCVVALDTEGYDLTEKVARGGPAAALVRNAFGTDPEVWRDASPITHAADGAPVEFLVVTRGLPPRRAEAARFVDAMNAAGGTATLLTAAGSTHADVNRRLGEPDEAVVTPAVRDFVTGCAR
jgi:acetyl esterase/lipase